MQNKELSPPLLSFKLFVFGTNFYVNGEIINSSILRYHLDKSEKSTTIAFFYIVFGTNCSC